MVRIVVFNDKLFPSRADDCIVIRHANDQIQISLPYWEDTPVIKLGIRETLNLRNALDEILGIKYLTEGVE